MKLKALLLFLFVPLICSATDINVDPSTFKATYEGAKDGDVLLMEEGTYTGDINLPDGKTVTLKAAEGAEVVFGVKFRGSDASVTGGGIIMEGLVIKPNDSYFMDLTYGDIKTITLRNCDLSAINRCFLRTNNEGHVIDKIEMDRCIIHDCGDGGYNFIYPKHGVREVSVTNSTLYNYKGGESFFSPNSMNVDIDMLFTFSNNTVYKWSKASKYAICNTGNKVGLFSEYTFRNNIIYKAGVDGQTPNILNTTGGYLLAEKNLIADYGTYNQASAADTEISDYTLADFGLTNIPFPDPENGDFSITSESPMATAATDGGPIGDPRWLKNLTNAVHMNVTNSPENAGTVTPAKADYEAGSEVTITATPNYGFRFKQWQDKDGQILSTENPYTFNIEKDMDITAVYSSVETYTLNINKSGDGAKWGNVSLTPEPVDGKYESGTSVTMKVVPNSVTSFLYWNDGSSDAQKTVVMNGDKTFTATFDVVPFIVGWDFSVSEPRGNRPGDYSFTTDNTGNLQLYEGDGKTTNWGASTRTFGGIERNCIRRYTERADMDNPRYLVAKFVVDGYKNIKVHSLAALDNACVHKIQKMQYSTDGVNYTDLSSIDMGSGTESSQWMVLEGTLPEGLSGQVYVRWIGDTESGLAGEPSDSDTEGFYLADIVVYADNEQKDDHEAPKLVATSPEAGSDVASASGNVVLHFNEKVKAGSGDVTINGKAMTPVFGSKTATYAYADMGYGTECEVVVPKGALTDLNGNAFEGTTFKFTTMQRPQPEKKVFDAVVAADGSGDFTSVQEAIDAAPDNSSVPYLIFVENGEYDELVLIPESKPFIHLIGQDKEKTVIKHTINNGGNSDVGYEWSTNNPQSDNYGYSSVVEVNASDFYTENITFYNSWGVDNQSGPMGLAMYSRNDRMTFYNCKFRSYQDTWQTSSRNMADRHYVKDCWIEGAVDYFYGGGDVLLEGCTLYNVRSGSVIVAPCHKEGTKFGYVFSNCTIDGNELANDNKTALGRPWHNAPKTVWLNTTMKIGIKPEGWNNMGAIPALFAEYNSMDADGNPVDLSNRRTEYEYTDGDTGQKVTGTCKATLTDEEAAAYTYEAITRGTDGWNPRKLMEAVSAPANMRYDAASSTLSWDESAYAICYVVTDADDKVVSISTDTSFKPAEGTCGKFTVKAVNEYGSLSEGTTYETTTGINGAGSETTVKEDIYNTSGMKLGSAVKGINIIRRQMGDGTVKVIKIMK